MSAWPNKIHYDLSWVGGDKQDILELQHQEYGYNAAHAECSKAAIAMLEELKVNPGQAMDVSMDGLYKHVVRQNNKINALIETIRGKM